ncbi:hypothetical protein EJB05_28859, partial [Eragrostis curvula]
MEEDHDENNTSRLLFDTNLVLVCEKKVQAYNSNSKSLHNEDLGPTLFQVFISLSPKLFFINEDYLAHGRTQTWST